MLKKNHDGTFLALDQVVISGIRTSHRLKLLFLGWSAASCLWEGGSPHNDSRGGSTLRWLRLPEVGGGGLGRGGRPMSSLVAGEEEEREGGLFHLPSSPLKKQGPGLGFKSLCAGWHWGSLHPPSLPIRWFMEENSMGSPAALKSLISSCHLLPCEVVREEGGTPSSRCGHGQCDTNAQRNCIFVCHLSSRCSSWKGVL